MSTDAEDVLQQACDFHERNGRAAMATVLSTWGSAPRQAGSQLAVSPDGAFAGSVSGGCVEVAVIEAARELMDSGGSPRRLELGVSDDEAWQAGLPCGGRIEVLVDSIDAAKRARLEQIRSDRAARRPAVLMTDLTSGEQRLLHPSEDTLDPDAPHTAAQEALRNGKSAVVRLGEREAFLHVFEPTLRLVVVGAVHVAQTLAPMAALNGLEVTVVDPRRAFATPERFPGVRLEHLWPDEALTGLALDRRTAVVTLSHDPKLDDPALEAALRGGAFYVGALGSRRSHQSRLQRLRERGIDEVMLERIRGPVGLDIGARTAAEIATSIVAELVAVFRKGEARSGHASP
ncbi:MAG: XdhC family protein [Polyangiales bacterium]